MNLWDLRLKPVPAECANLIALCVVPPNFKPHSSSFFGAGSFSIVAASASIFFIALIISINCGWSAGMKMPLASLVRSSILDGLDW